jgi:hypothetical protein
VFGRKTGRIHHLLSDIEWRLFLHLEWCDLVSDIREPFPLDRAATRQSQAGAGQPALLPWCYPARNHTGRPLK